MDKLELAAAILKELRDYTAALGRMASPGVVDVNDLAAWILMRDDTDTSAKDYIASAAFSGRTYYLAPAPRFATEDISEARRMTKAEAEQFVSSTNADVEGVKFDVVRMAPPQWHQPIPGDYYNAQPVPPIPAMPTPR